MLWFLIQFLLDGDCQDVIDVIFEPRKRHDHTAAIVDDKLYILGGSGYGGDHEFFYLNVSSLVDTQTLIWYDLSSHNTVPSRYGAAAVESGADNNTLVVYDSSTALIYTFNSQKREWIIKQISENNIVGKQFLTVINIEERMYIFVPDTNEPQMILMNVNLDSQGVGKIINAPSGLADYSATLLPDKTIIYIGKNSCNFV